MATLVFSALGTIVGGPVGGAIGALIGRAADGAIIGSSTREGARLTELAVSTSSYGQPIARLFGATRAAGTIVWATDLEESSETSGGGKGQPRVRQYSYSVSLAIALSSRPIEGVGRIWADGNLLRGAAGDLKTGGSLRIHLGHADQERDPLLAAALGDQCPAHRGLAYVVFEDLQLGDFGNRIPALSFEVFAPGAGADLPGSLLEELDRPVKASPVPDCAPMVGYVHEGGSPADLFAALSSLTPLVMASCGEALAIAPESEGPVEVLPPPVAWRDGDFGLRTGQHAARGALAAPTALRYYDGSRDYQPGQQRALGRAAISEDRTVELPVTLDPAGAQALVETARLRAAFSRDRFRLRIASLDARLAPGCLVALGDGTVCRVDGWEWRDGGVELDLSRSGVRVAVAGSGDGGAAWHPADRLPAPTRLQAFELPWDGSGAADVARVHCAVGAPDGRWPGAALYADAGGGLVPIAASGSRRAIGGVLAASLGRSPALLFEPAAAIEIECDWGEAELVTIDNTALAAGGNRLLVGSEIVQFMVATSLGAGRWRLSGLLRGRGGTEAEALTGHAAGTPIALLDDRLVLLDPTGFDPATDRIAAIGAGDAEPVYAAVRDPGRSRAPLSPVHPVVHALPDGALALEWTRRARGQWVWLDGVETALVEEAEAYEIGAGPLSAPLRTWTSASPAFSIVSADLSDLAPGTQIWVRQIGSIAHSPAVTLHVIV